MFEDKDFEVFDEPTLAGRMTAIREQLDSKFENFAKQAVLVLQTDGQAWYAHVAKHLRRTVYPPENTWVALAPNKRGYKMLPHFELGFWDDRLYLYLSCLENLKKDADTQKMWTERLQQAESLFSDLPEDYVISPNHMEKPVLTLSATHLAQTIADFGAKQHTEFSIGINVMRGDTRFGTEQLNQDLVTTLNQLLPVYEALKD